MSATEEIECVPACEHGGFCVDGELNTCICSSSWSGPGCSERHLLTIPPLTVIIGFVVIVVASHSLGRHAPQYLKLPLITGYLLVGIMAGSSVLDLIPESHIRELALIDSLSLSFISFTAGTKMVLRDYRSTLKSVFLMSGAVLFVEFAVVLALVLAVSSEISFMVAMSFSEKFAVCLFLATLMTARSPATILAIIEELKVAGPFTRMATGVTVITDMLVILVFAFDRLVADSIFNNEEDSGTVFGIAIGRIAISSVLGYLLGLALPYILFEWVEFIARTSHLREKIVKCAQVAILFLLGFALFMGDQIEEAMVDPLLASMIAGFYIANFSSRAVQMVEFIHSLSPVIYVAFFTVTGAALSLESLGQSLGLAIGLCLVRAVGMFLGSYLGGRIAKTDPFISKYSWMAYITQAGVSFGLSKKIHNSYPSWGGDFALVVISAVILNQLLGPPLCKFVLKKSGEAAANVMSGNCLIITDVAAAQSQEAVTHELRILSLVLKKANWQSSVVDVDALRDEDNPENVTTLLTAAIRGEDMDLAAGDSSAMRRSSVRDSRAASFRIQREELDTFKGAESRITAVVLMLSEDKMIRNLVHALAVHHPKIQIVCRLLPSSSLRTVKNLHLAQFFESPNILPDSVCVCFGDVCQAQTLSQMILTPTSDLFRGEMSIFQRTARGLFGSPGRLIQGDDEMQYSGTNQQFAKRMRETIGDPEQKFNAIAVEDASVDSVQLHVLGSEDMDDEKTTDGV